MSLFELMENLGLNALKETKGETKNSIFFFNIFIFRIW